MEIRDARLAYRKNEPNSGFTTLTVTFNVHWTAEELRLRGVYYCKIVLFGKDWVSDETLTTVYASNIECNGTTNPVSGEHTFVVPNRTLNEDGSLSGRGARDEVYAKVYVYAGTGIGRTNTIRDKF
jgi:hypothetical protein